MYSSQLISISLFTIAVVITLYSWMDRISGKNAIVKEAFTEPHEILNSDVLQALTKTNESVPTDKEAIQAHQTLLRYIRNDFNKGIKFVMDFGNRFYGPKLPLKENLRVDTLMDNYTSPLQGV